MRPQHSATPDDIDIVTLFAAVRQSLPKILVCTLLIGGTTYAARSIMLPRYTSQAQLEVLSTGVSNPFDAKSTGGFSDVSSRMDKEAVGTHVGGLKSTDLAMTLVKELKLATKPEFNAALPPEDLWSRLWAMAGVGAPNTGETGENRALTAFTKALRVFQVKETRGIVVEFTSADPDLAAIVANRLSEGYRASLSGRAIVQTEDARVKLAPQIERLTKDVTDADAQINEFRGKANLFRSGPQNAALNDQQLGELSTELSKLQTARSETDARASAARDMMSRGTAEALPDVQKSALVPKLVEQRVRLERQISELSATLLPAHPRMKQLVADLGGLQKQIKTELQKVVDSIEKDAKIVGDREADLKRRLDEAKKTVVSSSADDGRLRSLEDSAKSKREELARLQKLLLAAESTVSAKAVPTEIQIVSRAIPASETAPPKNSMLAAAAAVATFVLGLSWVLMRSMLWGARSPSTGRGRAAPAAAPPVQSVQSAPHAQLDTSTAVSNRVQAPLHSEMPSSEALPAVSTIASFAARLLDRPVGPTGYRMLLTGDTAATSGSAEAVALVKALSAGGRHAVLVDWMSADEGLARNLAFSHKPGMTDLLTGAAAFDDVIQRIPNSEAHFIATGTPADTTAAMDADRNNLVLDALDEAYQFIVIHSSKATARDLFANIQGRFDAGILVRESQLRTTGSSTPAKDFLGFEVPGMDIITVDQVTAPAPALGTLSRGLGPRARMAAPAPKSAEAVLAR
jgi:polysaccharide biosynthesis transport protein